MQNCKAIRHAATFQKRFDARAPRFDDGKLELRKIEYSILKQRLKKCAIGADGVLRPHPRPFPFEKGRGTNSQLLRVILNAISRATFALPFFKGKGRGWGRLRGRQRLHVCHQKTQIGHVLFFIKNAIRADAHWRFAHPTQKPRDVIAARLNGDIVVFATQFMDESQCAKKSRAASATAAVAIGKTRRIVNEYSILQFQIVEQCFARWTNDHINLRRWKLFAQQLQRRQTHHDIADVIQANPRDFANVSRLDLGVFRGAKKHAKNARDHLHQSRAFRGFVGYLGRLSTHEKQFNESVLPTPHHCNAVQKQQHNWRDQNHRCPNEYSNNCGNHHINRKPELCCETSETPSPK